MKLNNKGFTVVELIVTFSIVAVAMIGLLKVVDSYRETEQNESYIKSINGYRNEVIRYINDRVLDTKEVEGVDVNSYSYCSNYQQGVEITKKDDSKLYICVGGKETIGEDDSNYGIKIGTNAEDYVFFEAPSKFIKFEDDIILKNSNITNQTPVTTASGDEYKEQYSNITIKLKHSELKETFTIKVPIISRNVEESDEELPEYFVIEFDNISDIKNWSKQVAPEAELKVTLDPTFSSDDVKKIVNSHKQIKKVTFDGKIFENIINDLENIINDLEVDSIKFSNLDINGSNINVSNTKANNLVCDNCTMISSASFDISDLPNDKKIKINNSYFSKLVIYGNKDYNIEIDNSTTIKEVEIKYGIPGKTSLSNLDTIPNVLKGKIKSIVIGDNFSTIGASAFNGYGLESVTFPKKLQNINGSAFAYNDIKEIDLSQTQVKNIYASAFVDNNNISSIKLPTTLTNIHSSAFFNTGWTCKVESTGPICTKTG